MVKISSTNSNNSSLPYLVIVGVVAVVAVVVLVMNGSANLQGADVFREQVSELQPSCLDNDPENRYDFKGTVHIGVYKSYDYCGISPDRSRSKLFQAYCASGNNVEWVDYECPNGCLNGVCK